MQPEMTMRDRFAAAALTGLLASDQYDRLVVAADYADTAYELADAMLRERERTTLDAAPAATAGTPGTGDTQEPVAWGVAGLGRLLAASTSRIDAVDMQSDYECPTEVVQLYRKPPAPDFASPPPDNAAKAPDNAEPFAWAIQVSDDVWSFTHMPHVVRRWPQAEVVPLYRQPPVTKPMPREKRAEVSAEPVAVDDALRGLLGRLGGGK